MEDFKGGCGGAVVDNSMSINKKMLFQIYMWMQENYDEQVNGWTLCKRQTDITQ